MLKPNHFLLASDHPEPMVMRWSSLELAAIRKYAEEYAAKAVELNSPTWPAPNESGKRSPDSVEEVLRSGFKSFADSKYGPAPDPRIPQHLRYDSMFEAWKDGVSFRGPHVVGVTLPTPFIYAHELIQNGGGIWLGTCDREILVQSHIEGETGDEVKALYTEEQLLLFASTSNLSTSS